MCLMPMPIMKLVVTGTAGTRRLSTSRSARSWARCSSEEKRRKSSCWVGLAKVGAARGGLISSQSW